MMGLDARKRHRGVRPNKTSPEVITLFLCSIQFSMEFQMLIKFKMLKKIDFSCVQILRYCIYHADKYQNANDCWYFNIYEHDTFHAQLSWAQKSLITSGSVLSYREQLDFWNFL